MNDFSSYPAAEIALLRAMAGDAWSPAQTQRYTLALTRLEPHVGRAVVREMALEKWRPSPMEILRRAARVVSPFPDSDLAYGEMIYKARTIGLYGRRDPERPSVFHPGPPPFSHALVGYPIFCLGGWQAICEGEAGRAHALKAQYRDAYEHGANEWVETVAAQLHRAVGERDQRYFRRYTPFVRPVDFSEEEEMARLPVYKAPALEPHTEAWMAAREDARRVAEAAFNRIPASISIKRIPPVTVLEPFTPDMRRAVEEEVRRHREGKR